MKRSVAISYSITENYQLIKEYWKLKHAGKKVDTPKVFLGGRLSFEDEIYQYNQPYGFRILDANLNQHVIVSAKDNALIFNGKNTNKEYIFNDAFNDLHDVAITSKGFLVLSSGLDALVEVDKDSNTIWSHYLAFDEEINTKTKYMYGKFLMKNKDGFYIPKKNFKKISIKTSDRTVHPNSVEIQRSIKSKSDKDRFIWITMFHQSAIGRIDKFSNKLEIKFSGLKNPHGIKEHENFWSVVNTRGRQVYLLDKESMIKGTVVISKTINVQDTKWIQDATLDDDNNVWLLNTTKSTLDVYSYISGKLIYREQLGSDKRAQHIALV